MYKKYNFIKPHIFVLTPFILNYLFLFPAVKQRFYFILFPDIKFLERSTDSWISSDSMKSRVL